LAVLKYQKYSAEVEYTQPLAFSTRSDRFCIVLECQRPKILGGDGVRSILTSLGHDEFGETSWWSRRIFDGGRAHLLVFAGFKIDCSGSESDLFVSGSDWIWSWAYQIGFGDWLKIMRFFISWRPGCRDSNFLEGSTLVSRCERQNSGKVRSEEMIPLRWCSTTFDHSAVRQARGFWPLAYVLRVILELKNNVGHRVSFAVRWRVFGPQQERWRFRSALLQTNLLNYIPDKYSPSFFLWIHIKTVGESVQ